MQSEILACVSFSAGVGVNNIFESLPEIWELVRALQQSRTKSLKTDAGSTAHGHEDVAAAVQGRKDAANARVTALVQRQLAVRLVFMQQWHIIGSCTPGEHSHQHLACCAVQAIFFEAHCDGLAVYDNDLYRRREDDSLQFDWLSPSQIALLPCVQHAISMP